MRLQMNAQRFSADQKLLDIIQKKADKLDLFFDKIAPNYVEYQNDVSCLVVKNDILKQRKMRQILEYL